MCNVMTARVNYFEIIILKKIIIIVKFLLCLFLFLFLLFYYLKLVPGAEIFWIGQGPNVLGVLCSFFWEYYAPSFDFANKWSKKLITDLTDEGFSPNPSRHICYFPYSDKRKLVKTGMLKLNYFICLESTEDIFSQALYKGNNNSNPRFISEVL